MGVVVPKDVRQIDVRDVAFALHADSGQHGEVSDLARLGQQSTFADSRFTSNHQDSTLTLSCVGQAGLDHVQFVITADQHTSCYVEKGRRNEPKSEHVRAQPLAKHGSRFRPPPTPG